MTDPGFRIKSRHQTAPFLARTTFSDYHLFGDAKCAVLVEPRAARGMRAAAEQALPHETGGLLSGRALRDDLGSYVVVSGFIEAKPTAGQVATFQITTQELGVLRTRAARANPGADEVGWWHSHRMPSSYSQTDVNTQRMFVRPDSVGLLVFASGKQWAAAYVGPDSHDLGYSLPPAGRHTEPTSTMEPAQRAASSENPAGCPVQPDAAAEHVGALPAGAAAAPVLTIPGPPTGRWRLSAQALLLIVALLVVVSAVVMLAALLLGVSSISGRVSGLQQSLSSQMTTHFKDLASQDSSDYDQLSAQVGSAHDAPAATPSPAASSPVIAASVAWSCVRQAPGKWMCTATSSPRNTSSWEVEWLVDGIQLGPGRTQVPIAVPATERVQAVLVSPAGARYPGPVQTLSP